MSETRLVYVVGFQPATDNATVGGFDWFPASDRARAVVEVMRHLADDRGGDRGDSHSVTFVPLLVPVDLDRDETTRWIESNLHFVEVGR